jgi:transcriptional regulator with XRE-family HTH domain
LTLRRRIEIECNRVGISRAELARRVGKLPQALNDMLARGDMKASLLKRISAELGVTMELLMSPLGDEQYEAAKEALAAKKKSGSAEFFN